MREYYVEDALKLAGAALLGIAGLYFKRKEKKAQADRDAVWNAKRLFFKENFKRNGYNYYYTAEKQDNNSYSVRLILNRLDYPNKKTTAWFDVYDDNVRDPIRAVDSLMQRAYHNPNTVFIPGLRARNKPCGLKVFTMDGGVNFPLS